MPDLADGESVEVQGSSGVYTLKNTGGVYSCTCPAWRNQSLGIERRTCKHLRQYRGDEAEQARLGDLALSGRPPRAPRAAAEGGGAAEEEGEAPPLLLAHKWEGDVDLAGWWMSEKLDGVRAYWDGKQFLSRLGNRFFPPGWFTTPLPAVPLDGELWGGRKRFQRTVGIVKRQDESPLWRELQYVIFDAPAHEGTFEERLAYCAEVAGNVAPHIVVHPHHVCRDIEHLRGELGRVESLGGEGLMMRKPGSRYEACRSHTLLKVKTFHDSEARVVQHLPGTGRHKGRTGALLVELPDGTRFSLGTGLSDAERDNPPPIGALVTFRYQELSDGGVPRFPSFVAVRDDVRWEDLAAAAPTKKGGKPTVASRPAPSPARPAAAKPAPGSTTRPPPAPVAAAPQRFEYDDGETRAFWEIVVEGKTHRVRFGTIDVRFKRFASAEEAHAEASRRIAEKIGKGFRPAQ